MDTLDAIFSRRSIRQFTDRRVSDEHVDTLLRAGMAAPSAGNAQPWHLVVIRNRETLTAIPKRHPHARMTAAASLALLVCAEPTLEKYPGRWPLDCSAVTQNILLAAHALGLGAVWVGLYPEEKRMAAFRELCALPEDIQPVALIPIGHPGEEKGPADRFNPDRVHQERW